MPLPADARWAYAAAALLGRRHLPYQQQICSRISEPNLAGTGYASPTVVVLLPRQVGKTTVVFDLLLGRTLHRADYRAAYTAQTGHTVTERFSDPGGWFDQVEGSSLASRYRLRRSQGTERIANRTNRSFLKAFPPKPGKLRSNALDAVVLDECQEHTWEVGRALDADVGPVFTTRPRRQLILAGTASGPSWWHDKYLAAKRGDMLLVEIGTWPDDADPEDPQTWRDHHPGLRAGLTDEEFLASQLRDLGPAAFAREYGNRWDDSATLDLPVPLTAWDACTPAAGRGRPAAVAFDVTLDRTRATLVGVTDTGLVRLVDRGPLDELPAMLADYADGMTVHALPGQSGVAADLRAAGHHVTLLSATEYRQACQQLRDAVTAGTVHHDHQPELRTAWEQAGRSWHGDTWVLSARRSDGDITPATAATVAWWAAHKPAPLLV